MDIANDYGSPIYAVGDGEVLVSGPAQGYGQWIRILQADGTITEYGHMRERDVATGDHVTAGQLIAQMGSEGTSSGPHLHLRVWADPDATVRTDPIPYLAERGITMPCTPGTGPHPAPLVYPAQSGRVVSARSADGRLEVFAAGANGVSHAWQTAVSGAWSDWERFGTPAGAAPRVARDGTGRLNVTAIAPSGTAAFHRRQSVPSGGWDDWRPLLGWSTASPLAAPGADGRLEALTLAPGGDRLAHRWQSAPGGTWAPDDVLGEDFGEPGLLLAAPPSAAADPTGRLHVFAVAEDGRLRTRVQERPGGGWRPWAAFGDRPVAPLRSGAPMP
ncbi:peptidoglycan DD-metalloendopeptidase family protein [Kitasatospora sp. NBC_00039]|uniref:peptidoglycan DD-metalloendopeptidase family protein n=1 Tax=Kitasatospora sp. NBC_00039 TaxID=2903565 RepID=UPI003863A9F6